MERERWDRLYALILKLGKSFRSGWKYPTTTIAAIHFWAVGHDRPTAWACRRANWPACLPWRSLPPQDRMSRRLKTSAVRGLLAAVEAALRAEPEPIKAIDSKPLVVGICSKDREARWGRVTGGCAVRGYKLHALWDGGTLPIAWWITAMNVQDGVGGRPLLERLTGRGRVLGDGQYDQNVNYELAAAHGHQLIAMPRRRGAGRGHRPQSPHRLRGLRLAQRRRRWLRTLRSRIELHFAGLTSFGGGLHGLPPWVRGLQRVTRWVQAKLILNALRIQSLTTPANA